ncbi:hypothetical protein O5D80_003662 [Batrachochytrium dendrobatidis]|nr:hypothetical protein O5D80_003662 [Batrachochytrium dendrobatidis]
MTFDLPSIVYHVVVAIMHLEHNQLSKREKERKQNENIYISTTQLCHSQDILIASIILLQHFKNVNSRKPYNCFRLAYNQVERNTEISAQDGAKPNKQLPLNQMRDVALYLIGKSFI